MNEMDIKRVLSEQMEKYAALELAVGNRDALLEKGAVVDTIPCRAPSLLLLRDALLKLGDIFEIDEDSATITAAIPTGAMEAKHAFVVARIRDNAIETAAWFREGLIKQHGAEHAIEKLRQQLAMH